MKYRVTKVLLALGVVCLLWSSTVRAKVNPNFTPKDLVDGAKLILHVRIDPSEASKATGAFPMKIIKVIKGERPTDKLSLDLSKAAQPERAQAIQDRIFGEKGVNSLLFVGKDEDGNESAVLQMDRNWLRIEPRKGGVYGMQTVDSHLLGTWDGATDTLAQAVAYLLQDDDADVPAFEGVGWGANAMIGEITGNVNGAEAVDLSGKGNRVLFIPAESGDKIYQYDAASESMKEIGAELGLASKSRHAAWADFNGDGRLDLLSCGSEAMSLWVQGADGKFVLDKKEFSPDLGAASECVGLTVVDVGQPSLPGVVVSKKDHVVLLARNEKGEFLPKPLVLAANGESNLGTGARCLAADLDGDGYFDLLQPFSNGSLFHKGKGKGVFETPIQINVAMGEGRAAAHTGDYDGDGVLDIVGVSESGTSLWQNRGKLVFEEVLGLSGEIPYSTKPGGIFGQSCDINNDGRQDLFIVNSSHNVELFFSRGFRNLCKSLDLIWTNADVMGDSSEGLQAGVVADFDHNGSQDMALVLKDGQVRVYFQEFFEDDGPSLAVRATLPLKGSFAGPVTVTGWIGTRCLGAQTVTAGTSEGYFGLTEAGEITLKWTLPGGEAQEKTLTLIEESSRLDLSRTR